MLCCHLEAGAGPADDEPADVQRPSLLAEIFRTYGPEYLRRHRVTHEQYRVIRDIIGCRTVVLGGHVRRCADCGYTEIRYNSCCNRHCPTCQWMARATWIEERKAQVLPVGHFFSTFTLPEELRGIALQNQRAAYTLMFGASYRTLAELGRGNLGELGVTSVLHTWTRQLDYHPHVHTMETSGGLKDEEWNPTKPDYLFSIRRMGALFRKYMLQGLHALYEKDALRFSGKLESLSDRRAFGALMRKLWRRQWVVDVQPPRGRPEHAIKYLADYTHRVAISDHRVLSLIDGQVTIRTRGKGKVTLGWEEFIRRFLLHVLPKGFHKVRHYGLYSNSGHAQLELAREIIADSGTSVATEGPPEPKMPLSEAETWEDRVTILTGHDPRVCPRCGRREIRSTSFGPRGRRVGRSVLEDTS